jgi:hypothetical protein
VLGKAFSSRLPHDVGYQKLRTCDRRGIAYLA